MFTCSLVRPLAGQVSLTRPLTGDQITPLFDKGPCNEVPGPFLAGDWTLTDAGTGGVLSVGILSLPSDDTTDIEYRVDGVAWISTGSTTSFSILALTNLTSYDVEIRAVNIVGVGEASDVKTATPTGP